LLKIGAYETVSQNQNTPSRKRERGMLDLISETATIDGPATDPKFGRAFAFDPPVNLVDLHVFTSGQPFEAFKKMRENAPVCWCPEDFGGVADDGPGFWSVTAYDLVKQVELDPETFSSQAGGIQITYGPPETRHPLMFPATLNNMIAMDRPNHFTLRREHMKFFTSEFARNLRARVDAKIDELLDNMEAIGPRLDMVEHFSQHLPLFTMCEILGFPEDDRPKLVGWMHHLELAADIVNRQALGEIDPNVLLTYLASIDEVFAYGRDILLKRRADPKDDLLTAIATTKIDGAYLPDEFLDGSWLLIIFAGNDTTRNTLSGTMRLLTENMDQRRKLIENPALMPGMVDEAIRCISPVIFMRRTATKDTELGGQEIAAGEKLALWYGAANRDPSVFENPDQFDIERQNASSHIGFGMGPHICLGQRMANMQLSAAYAKILQRFPDMAWTGKITISPQNFVHAISSLEVDLTGKV
jgi:cytochrome P450